MFVQLLPDPVGPSGVVRDRRDDDEGGIPGVVDGVDDAFDVVEYVLFRVPVIGATQVVGSTGDDEASRNVGQLWDGPFAEVLPPTLILLLVEGSSPADVGEVGGCKEALVFSSVVVDGSLVF